MSRFKWDPDVNITRHRPAGMTSKVTANSPADETPTPKGKVTKSKQFRRVKKEKSRLAVQGTEKRQSTMLMKHWKYRNFKRCGQCGEYDTYESRNPEWTRTTVTKKLSEMFPTVPEHVSMRKLADGVDPSTTLYEVEVELKYWCYKCGAVNDKVTDKYQADDRFAPRGRITTCAECPNVIDFAKGDKAWRTGEKDGVTGRDDYRCDPCEQKRLAEARAEKEARKLAETSE